MLRVGRGKTHAHTATRNAGAGGRQSLVRRLARLEWHSGHLRHVEVQFIRRDLQKRGRDSLSELVVAVDDRCRVVRVNRDPAVKVAGIRLRPTLAGPRKLTWVLRERGRDHCETDNERAAGLEELTAGKFREEVVAHRVPPVIASPARLMAFIRRGYVPHRQMWPFMAVRISASVGFGFFDRSSAA